jgi:Domain of unknown function (DUF2017)
VSRFKPPVRRKGPTYVIELGRDESSLVLRLIGELRALLTDPEPTIEAQQLMARLFPVAHPDDEQLEAEYQRWMRDELVQSKLAAIAIVEDALEGDGVVDEGHLMAVMQAINSLRLVLGTLVGVTDDPTVDEVVQTYVDTPEYALYGYLSWLLEHCVTALTP